MVRQRDPRVFSPEWAPVHFVYGGADFWVDTSILPGLGVIVWFDSEERGWTIASIPKDLPEDIYAAIKIWVHSYHKQFKVADFLAQAGFGDAIGTPDAI